MGFTNQLMVLKQGWEIPEVRSPSQVEIREDMIELSGDVPAKHVSDYREGNH